MARRRGAVDPLALLLVGVVVSTVNGAVILALHQWAWARGLSTGEELQRWLMGYLDEGLRSYEVLGIAALLGAALARLSRLAGAMDASSFSDAEALSLGVSLGRLRVELFVAAWLLASAAVAMAGPLAFVGMVSPHLARLAVGPRHRGMLWASAAIGAALVMLADAGTRLAEGPFGGRLPLGVFTAWLGGPVFVLLLRRGLRAGAGQA
jgi:iron complex transport system permease protein